MCHDVPDATFHFKFGSQKPPQSTEQGGGDQKKIKLELIWPL